jgi:hypothetical protein
MPAKRLPLCKVLPRRRRCTPDSGTNKYSALGCKIGQHLLQIIGWPASTTR